MKPKIITHDLLVIAVLTLITVFVWIGTDIYRIATRKTIPAGLEEQLVTLSPNIDIEILNQLESRRVLP